MDELDEIWTTLETEQPDSTLQNLDTLSTLELVTAMNEADKTVPQAVQRVLPQVTAAIDQAVEQLNSGGRLFYVGAGTSGRLGILDAAECPPTFNTSPHLVQAMIAGGKSALFEAVENAEDHPEFGQDDLKERGLNANDVVVGIAASGRTPYVLGALRYGQEVGALTISVSCNLGAAISEYADVPIEVNTGPEILAGSTRLKAGTAQKLILNMLSTGTMVRLGKVYRNLMVDLKATNEKLVERSKRIIMFATGVSYEKAATALADAQGHVKLAILMLERGVDLDAARRLLDQSKGFLRQALGGSVEP